MGRWTLNRVTPVSLACTLLISSSALAFADTAAETAASAASSTATMTADSAPEAVKQFEKRLFMRNYGRDPLAARVARIENHIFGQATEGDVQSRVAHLEQVLKQQLDHEKEQRELMGTPSTNGEPAGAGTTGGAPQQPSAGPSQPSAPLNVHADPAERARIAAQAAREEEIDSLLSIGVELYRRKRGPEALNKFSQVLRLDPHNAQAHFNLGIIKESMGNYVEALGNYQQAAHDDPDTRDYSDAVMAIQAKAEKQRQSVGQNAEFKQLSANANAAFKRGEYMSALDLYLQLDAREPNKALVKYNIGSIYMMLKDRNNALSYYSEAHKLAPGEPKYANAFKELSTVVAKERQAQGMIQQNAQQQYQQAQGGLRVLGHPMPTNGMSGMPRQMPMQQMQPSQLGSGGRQPAPMQQMQMQPQQSMQMPMQMQPQQSMQIPMQMQPQQSMQMPMQMPMQMQPQQSMQMPMQQMPTQQGQAVQQRQLPPVQQGNGYANLTNGANNSPFAQILTPNNASTGQQGRSAFGLAPGAAQQFRGTTFGTLPAPMQSGLAAFGIAGKPNGEGVTVAKIGQGSRAALAGMQPGDDIRAVDGNQVTSIAEVNDALAKASSGAKVKFVILRGGNLAVLEL